MKGILIQPSITAMTKKGAIGLTKSHKYPPKILAGTAKRLKLPTLRAVILAL